MPYGDDAWLERAKEAYDQARFLVTKEFDDDLRLYLKQEYNIPDEFMDLAVRIW